MLNTHRIILIFSLVAGSTSTAWASAYSVWPLVKSSQGAVRGRLTEIREGEQDRLLLIDVSGSSDNQVLRGPGSFRLLDRAGRLPEGMPIRPGATGFFLYNRPIDGAGEFGTVDGWFLSGGFVEVDLTTAEASLVESLLTEGRNRKARTPLAALDLLRSPNPSCRALALGSLAEANPSTEPGEREILAAAFRREKNAENQGLFLQIFILRNWPLAGEGVVEVILHGEELHLLELAMTYLARHAGPREKALLLQAYPFVSPDRRRTLLRTYARIGLPEARTYWSRALLSDDSRDVNTVLTELAISGLPEVEEVYTALLESSDPKIRRQAVCGLAAQTTPTAGATLRHFLSQVSDEDPLRTLVENVLRHPYRYGRMPRVHPGPPPSSEKNR